MKRNTLLLLLLFVMAIVCLPAKNPSGFILGLGSTGFTGDDAKSYDDGDMSFDLKNKTGIYLGYFMTYPASPNFDIRTEIAVNTRGAKYTMSFYDGYDDYDFTGSYNLIYLNVPVTGIYSFKTANAGLAPYLGGGLSLGLPVSAKIKLEGEGQSADEDILDQLSTPVIGYQLCGGVDFGKTYLELRYDRQITPLFDGGDDSFNSATWLLVGFKMGR
jgi:hypothetical protein